MRPIEDSDKPVHLCNPIRVFNGRSMGSQASNVSSDGKLRLCSDCVDAQTYLNLRSTHMPVPFAGHPLIITKPDRRQAKTLLTIDEQGSKIARNSVSISICRQSGDKWQSITLFLMIFDLRSSIVLMFSIVAYPV